MVWVVLSFVQNFLKRLYGLNHIVFWSKRSKKTIWVEPYCLLVKIFLKDSMGWSILSFVQTFLKRLYGLKHIVFWSKLSKKTVWIEPYCLLIETSEKDNMGWSILSFGKNFRKIFRFLFKDTIVEMILYCLCLLNKIC